MRVGDTSQDTILGRVLPGALRALERYCNRKFCEYEEEAFSVYCNDTGSVSAATVTVTESTLTLVNTGGDNAGTNTLTLADAANDTLTELVAVIEALDGWTATISSSATGTASSTELTPAAAQSCIGSANAVTLGYRVDITEYFDGDGKTRLWPQYIPLISVTSLYDDTDRTFTDSNDALDDDDYALFDDYLQLVDNNTFNVDTKNIRLIYRGGYTPAQLDDDERSDLRLAAAQYVNYIMQQISTGPVQAQVDIDGMVQRPLFFGPIPAMVRALLEPYKRKVFF